MGGVAIWWAVVAIVNPPGYVLPWPGAVVERGWDLGSRGVLNEHIGRTLAAIVRGVPLGAVLGVIFAVLFTRVAIVERLLMPIVIVAQVTPKISIAPLIVLWLGLGIASKVALIALVTFYPVLVNMVASLRNVPQEYDDLMRILAIRGVRRALTIDLPHSLPSIATGLRVGVLQAVTAAVIGEFIGASAGLGYLEKQAQDNDDIRLVLVVIGLLCLLGWSLYALVGLIERWCTRRFTGEPA